MKKTYTKGPWFLEAPLGNTGIWRVFFKDETGKEIDGKGVAVSASEENATLIAAAPDLLESLVEMDMIIEAGKFANAAARLHAINKMRRAIAKAKGIT